MVIGALIIYIHRHIMFIGSCERKILHSICIITQKEHGGDKHTTRLYNYIEVLYTQVVKRVEKMP